MINLYLSGMLLFNVTAMADERIGAEFESWIKKTHLPVVKAMGLFHSERLLRLTSPQQDGITYCLQFISAGDAAIAQYRQQFMPALYQKVQQQYAGQLFLIESQMEFIDDRD